MKWAFTIRNKFKIAGILLVVFMTLLIKNFVEKRHVSELGTSFSSVYKDRLLVEGYIYQLSNHLHVKKIVTDNCYNSVEPEKVSKSIAQQNHEIDGLMIAYAKTKLTKEEAVHLQELRTNLHSLNSLENSFVNRIRYGYPAEDLKSEMETVHEKASVNLHRLSEIQLAVGKQLNDESDAIMSESSIFSQFGLTLLIVLGLLIQILIFSSKDTVVKTVRNVRLN